MVLYQICVFGTDLKFNMAARVHNVFSLACCFGIRFLTTMDGRQTLSHDKTKAHMAYGQVS
jgi:hypothetical protein